MKWGMQVWCTSGWLDTKEKLATKINKLYKIFAKMIR
jgi:hypothetical protein